MGEYHPSFTEKTRKFLELTTVLPYRALLQQYGVQIRVLGRRDLLPPDVQESCAQAEAMTAHNTKCVSHFFFHLSRTRDCILIGARYNT